MPFYCLSPLAAPPAATESLMTWKSAIHTSCAAQLGSSITTTGHLVRLSYITKITHRSSVIHVQQTLGRMTASPRPPQCRLDLDVCPGHDLVDMPTTQLSYHAIKPSWLRVPVSLVRTKLVRSGMSCKPLNVADLGTRSYRRIPVSDGKPHIYQVHALIWKMNSCLTFLVPETS